MVFFYLNLLDIFDTLTRLLNFQSLVDVVATWF